MSQQNQQELINALQNENNNLKVRVFNAEEALKAEQQFKTQVFTALFNAMGVSPEDANNPQAYVDRAIELKALADAYAETPCTSEGPSAE